MYIVSSISIFFDLQIYFILRLKNKLRRAKDIDKIITSEKEIKKAREIEIKIRETEIEAKTIKTSTKANARASAKAIAATAITTTNKKYLLRLCEQFACTHISFVYKIVSILLSYLLLFNNL